MLYTVPLATIELHLMASSDHVVHIGCSGELDVSNVDSFVDAVDDVLAGQGRARACLDLAGVRLVDPKGIRGLLECQRRAAARGCELTVADPRPIVLHVLLISRALDLLGPPPVTG